MLHLKLASIDPSTDLGANTDFFSRNTGRRPQHHRPQRGHLRPEQATPQQADLAQLAHLGPQALRLGRRGRPDAREAGHAVPQRAVDLPPRRVQPDGLAERRAVAEHAQGYL